MLVLFCQALRSPLVEQGAGRCAGRLPVCPRLVVASFHYSSSWYRTKAAIFDCCTPWITFYYIFVRYILAGRVLYIVLRYNKASVISATSLSTYDFSTLYTTLPHNLIKEKHKFN